MLKTADKAILVLEFMAEAPKTLAEVTDALGGHRTTALRLLQSLVQGGLVRRTSDGRYGLGHRLIGLAHLARDQFDLRTVARPKLGELARFGHTVHLAALEGDHTLYVDKVDPTGDIRLYSQIGKPVPIHTAAVSKAILAYQSDDFVARVLDACDFARHTDSTITTRGEFLRELQATHVRGWAEDDGEMESFVNCIAVPIRDAAGGVIASISLTALRDRQDLEALRRNPLEELLLVGDLISKGLGWQP